MDAYLLKIKVAIDSLASVGYFLSTKDHVEAIFYGFPEDYDTFVVSISSRPDPYSVEAIESLLLSQKHRVKK